jgi:hypothetical protein
MSFDCKVVGVTFRTENCKFDRQEIISKLQGKEKIYLKREPKNPKDKNAVAVMVRKTKTKDYKVGYIRKELAAFLSDTWSRYKYVARICEIRRGDLKRGPSFGLTVSITKIERSKRFKKNK